MGFGPSAIARNELRSQTSRGEGCSWGKLGGPISVQVPSHEPRRAADANAIALTTSIPSVSLFARPMPLIFRQDHSERRRKLPTGKDPAANLG